jgi:benzil reductase ((S)-benzoin forming)
MQEHKDRVAVITGASRGLGAGLARELVAGGLKLALCARTEPSVPIVEDTDGGRLLFRQVDVRDLAALEAFADQAEAALGPIDLWINNAGLLKPVGPVRDADPAAFRDHIDVNVTGVFHGTRVFLRRLHATGRSGTLINITSGAAHNPYQGWGAYCAGKAAVDLFTQVVAEEEQEHDIRVHALAPGVIESSMQQYIRTLDAKTFPMVEKFRDLHRQGQLISPRIPARAILELAFGPQRSQVVVDVRDLPG